MCIGFNRLELGGERHQTKQSFNSQDRGMRGWYLYRGIVIGKLNGITTREKRLPGGGIAARDVRSLRTSDCLLCDRGVAVVVADVHGAAAGANRSGLEADWVLETRNGKPCASTTMHRRDRRMIRLD
jgi:hypothetical protein